MKRKLDGKSREENDTKEYLDIRGSAVGWLVASDNRDRQFESRSSTDMVTSVRKESDTFLQSRHTVKNYSISTSIVRTFFKANYNEIALEGT